MLKFIVFLSIFGSFFAKAQTLFQPADKMLNFNKHLELQSDPLVVPDRYRMARIDQNEIFRSYNNNLPLVINFFNDVELRANVEKVKNLPSGSSFFSGSLADGGYFTLLVHYSGIVRGSFHSSQGLYMVNSNRDDYNKVLLQQKDFSGILRCGNDLNDDHAHHDDKQNWIPASAEMTNKTGVTKKHHVTPASNFISAKAGISSKQATNNTIDVLVVYTQGAERYAGGPAQIKAGIEKEVTDMNYVLENSGLPHRQIKLAGIEKVDYIQSYVHLSLDHSNLHFTSEDNRHGNDYSALDEVYPLIEKYNVDLVHLVVQNISGACGVGGIYQLRYDFYEHESCEGSENYPLCMFNGRRRRWKSRRNGYRFSISAVECFDNNVFAHEVGHNLGLGHSRYTDGFSENALELGKMPWRPYGFGYSNPDLFSSQKICQTTVMGACYVSAEIQGVVNEPTFSNADLFFPPPTTDNPNYDPYLFQKDTPMGVHGEEYSDAEFDAPVNASRAIDDVWDIVASLSEPGDLDSIPTTGTSCNEGDIPSNVLSSSLNSQVSISSGGSTRDIMLSFSVPDNCSGVFVTAGSSSSAFNVSVTKVREGEFELSIRANPNNASCNTRRAEVTVELNGVSGVLPASTSVTQTSNNELCQSVSNLPKDSTSLDLSGQNSSSALRLANRMFAGFTQLESLNLSRNQLNNFRSIVFDGLEKLKNLDLSYNEFPSLPESAFSNLLTLESLNLSKNKIRNIPEAVFSDLTELRMLSLSQNELQELSDLSNNKKLESLWLYGNNISSLASDAFSKLSNLRIVNLSDNDLTTLPANIFQSNSNLTHVYLSANEIPSLPNVFSGLSKLRSLSLSKNELTELPNLSDLSDLMNLWAYSNNIEVLSNSALSGLSSLKNLDLSRNQISRIENNAFSDLSKVTHIRLYGNDISSLSASTFNGLSNVVFLTLSRNDITSLPNNVFSKMPNLQQLWIHSNKIRSISPNAFSGLSKLKYLNISHNPLDGPLPAQVCSFIRRVPKVHMNGIDMSTVCPQ